MKARVLTVLTVPAILLLLAADAKDDAAKADMKKLEGKWNVVSGESQGKPAPAKDLEGTFVIFRDGKLFAGMKSEEREMGAVKLDPTTKPKSMEIHGFVETAKADGKGKVIRGKEPSVDTAIYELDGGKLKLCVAHGQPKKKPAAPKEFKTEAGSDTMLLIMERAKK